MDIGLYLGQPAPPAVVDERPNQPDKQADRHAETGESGQASQHIPPQIRDLRGSVLRDLKPPTRADIEGRTTRNFGMCVQKARQRRIRRKVCRIAQQGRVER